MNYAFLPDLFALAILIFILLLVRRRHSQARADAWLVGLFFTLLEAVAHTFYARVGMPNPVLHVIVLDCYLMAGLVFIWAAGDQRLSRGSRLLYLTLNAVPLLGMSTAYGLHLRTPGIYVFAIAAGLKWRAEDADADIRLGDERRAAERNFQRCRVGGVADEGIAQS